MDRVEQYRNLIEKLLTDYRDWATNATSQQIDTNNTTIEDITLFDRTGDRYLWLQLGWHGKQRIDNIMLCVRIINQKIWIEVDRTETGLATDLLAAGLTPAEIVLAFYSHQKRTLTEFAIA